MANMRSYAELNGVFRQIVRHYEQAQSLDWVREKVLYALYQTWLDIDAKTEREKTDGK